MEVLSTSFSLTFLLISFLNIHVCLANNSSRETVILVSFDGFRWDFLDMNRANTKYFDSIVQNGVRAEYVKNVFPTVTFPNHYTIVTGLFPESHGLIANSMYDPVFDDNFTMRTVDSRWWNDGEPVWVTNEKQGRKSGLCFWPGYDVKIKGYTASYGTAGLGYGKPFVSEKPLMNWTARVDLVVSWLKNNDTPSFVAMYFDSPDEAGHCCGPNSENVTEEIGKTNNITGYLMERLREAGLLDKVNLIITADHGMDAYNASTVLDLNRYVASNVPYKIWSYSASSFFLNSTNVAVTYKNLKEAEKQTKKLMVYRKEEVPKDLHFRNSVRVPEIIVIMEEGWIASISPYNLNLSKSAIKGSHGWLPNMPAMRPFFIAQGPAFKQGYKSGPIDMVDIYPLMCHILGIKPASHNGSLNRISHLLRDNTETPPFNSQLSAGEIVALAIGSTIVITVCIYGFLMVLKDRRRSWQQHQLQEIDVPLMRGDEDEDVVT